METKTQNTPALDEMKKELLALRERVSSLESEVPATTLLRDQMRISQRLNERLVKRDRASKEDLDENLGVIDRMVENLKSPVSSVVGNLQDWTGKIQDPEIQGSMQACMETARSVLDSFDKAQKLCRSFNVATSGQKLPTNLREFFKELLSGHDEANKRFKIFIDKKTPEALNLDKTFLKSLVSFILDELIDNGKPEKLITIQITSTEDIEGESNILKLSIRMTGDQPTGIIWKGTWQESVDTGFGEEAESKIPMTWLECKNRLRRSEGDLLILSRENHLYGTEIVIPTEK